MKIYREKNKVGLFRKLRSDDWVIKGYPNGLTYKDGQVLTASTIVKPLYSYGNNYKKFDTEFSLFMWTTEDDIKKISKHFDKVVQQITEDDLNMGSITGFKYLEPTYEGGK